MRMNIFNVEDINTDEASKGPHVTDFQALTEFGLICCENLEAFCKETGNSEVKPIVSTVVKVLSNLGTLAMSPKERKWLQDSVGSDVYQMHNIKHLVLNRLCSMEILFWFLHRVPNLESLYLWSSAIEEVLPNESLASLQKIGTAVQLEDLRLFASCLPQNIGMENDPILQRLERLYFDNCRNLRNISPSLGSFTYLTHMKVRNCNGIKSLMKPSIAKSLVELTIVKVAECEMLQEIVMMEGNERHRR